MGISLALPIHGLSEKRLDFLKALFLTIHSLFTHLYV